MGCRPYIHIMFSHLLHHQPSPWRNLPEKEGWPFCLLAQEEDEVAGNLSWLGHLGRLAGESGVLEQVEF